MTFVLKQRRLDVRVELVLSQVTQAALCRPDSAKAFCPSTGPVRGLTGQTFRSVEMMLETVKRNSRRKEIVRIALLLLSPPRASSAQALAEALSLRVDDILIT